MGLDQVLADVGISKTAFYKHFSCKDDLVLAALELKNRWWQETVLEMIRKRGGASPVGQIHAILDVVQEIVDFDEYQGCIFINVALEFPLPHDPIHIAAAEHKKSIENIICDLAVAAGAADPRELAQELCLVLEGMYVTRQVGRNKGSFDVARRIVQRVIAAHLLVSASTVHEGTENRIE